MDRSLSSLCTLQISAFGIAFMFSSVKILTKTVYDIGIAHTGVCIDTLFASSQICHISLVFLVDLTYFQKAFGLSHMSLTSLYSKLIFAILAAFVTLLWIFL